MHVSRFFIPGSWAGRDPNKGSLSSTNQKQINPETPTLSQQRQSPLSIIRRNGEASLNPSPHLDEHARRSQTAQNNSSCFREDEPSKDPKAAVKTTRIVGTESWRAVTLVLLDDVSVARLIAGCDSGMSLKRPDLFSTNRRNFVGFLYNALTMLKFISNSRCELSEDRLEQDTL